MDIQTLQNFISKNSIPTKPGRKCVDGRYEHDENSGMIARAGGDFGYVMILLALVKEKKLNLTPEQCFDMVYSALRNLGEKFYFHTDHHAAGDGIGCGHAAKPMNEELAAAYQLNALDEQTLVAYAKKRYAEQNDGSIVLVNLPGDHREEAVLVVTGNEQTMNSQDSSHMFFIYDKTRDFDFIEKLISKLNIPEISVDEFKTMSDIQTNATLHNLALGKQIFEINGQEIKEIGFVS